MEPMTETDKKLELIFVLHELLGINIPQNRFKVTHKNNPHLHYKYESFDKF